MEARIRVYNNQRQTVADALAASESHRRVTEQRHEAFRAKFDEPWWDGGKYLSAGGEKKKM
jgi:hypothetical protein